MSGVSVVSCVTNFLFFIGDVTDTRGHLQLRFHALSPSLQLDMAK